MRSATSTAVMGSVSGDLPSGATSSRRAMRNSSSALRFLRAALPPRAEISMRRDAQGGRVSMCLPSSTFSPSTSTLRRFERQARTSRPAAEGSSAWRACRPQMSPSRSATETTRVFEQPRPHRRRLLQRAQPAVALRLPRRAPAPGRPGSTLSRKSPSSAKTPSGRPPCDTASVACTGTPTAPFPPPPRAASPPVASRRLS